MISSYVLLVLLAPVPLILCAQVPQSLASFPIPSDMHEIWPGAKLADAERQSLQKAMAADLDAQQDISQRGKKYTFASADTAEVALGSLGHAVLVLMSNSLSCGTGGCPIYVYVRNGAGYRKVLDGSFGWAFAVVNSKAPVPDLVIASNAGGGHITLTLYHYSGSTFAHRDCEMLTSKDKDGKTPTSWWDPAQVNIRPCT